MDVHLKELFGNFQHQFGTNTGNGRSALGTLPPLFPDCMMTKIEGVSAAFVKSIYRACSALYISNPWQRLRPHHLFGVVVHGSKPLFFCAHFVGNLVGDPALLLYRSYEDALQCVPTAPPHTLPNLKSVPAAGVLRLTFTSESNLPLPHKKMIKALGVEIIGPKAFPFIDVIFPAANGVNDSGFDLATASYSTPTLDELRWLFACVKAVTQAHPLLQQCNPNGLRGHRALFEEFSQTLDVQWPAEDAKFWEVTSVKITHPPQEHSENQKSSIPKSGDQQVATVDVDGWAVPRQCAMCNKEVSGDSAPRCSRCKAVIYCGHVCQKQHWKDQHKGSCELFKAMMEREEELELKGFNFPCLMEQPCKWLEIVSLHGKGMWRRMCGCYKEHEFGLLPVFPSGAEIEGPWGLASGMYPTDAPLLDHSGAGERTSMILLSGWAEYYDLRGLPMSSPVATLLSFPFSLYHIVTALNVATKTRLAKGKEVVVHYLGPEGELDWIPAFAELPFLLGGSGSLHVLMIGPEVPLPLSGATASAGEKLKLSFVKGLYQDEASSLPSPDVVVALNAGLESYSTWPGALEAIKVQTVAAFFTDFSEPCCANAKQLLRAAGLHISYPVTPNPFRSPVRNQVPSSNIPWFSNGFVLGVNT
ncbi:hypothetical protein GOP47_0010981 [Adiantum capillus-veneris]|uniref:MYND-type domain-containing protein n=1 Tax=Adiantum capillus-veneris TaxID=13818 RepID=A0A9D4UWC9_ADICA|nr:hypothetical protein GOP47_0010981 [Adiantum capillus-veneris]